MRWTESYHLFFLGALSFAAASIGRSARRRRWRNWLVGFHITGMGLSYILLLTAFYVDNGKHPSASCNGMGRPDSLPASAQSSRSAALTGMRAARTAGNRPPTKPIASAHFRPVQSSSGVTRNSKLSLPTEPAANVEALKPLKTR
jgi:hypothetical protein